MQDSKKDKKTNKGILGAIWESMTKTGGCCCSSGNCCGPARSNAGKQKTDQQPLKSTSSGSGQNR